MQNGGTIAVLDEILEPVTNAFSRDVAQALVNIRAGDAMQARIADLAGKCNEGLLTPAEHAEYGCIRTSRGHGCFAPSQGACLAGTPPGGLMDPALRRLVVERADFRCEYCLLHCEYQSSVAFHVEHIIARQHGGADSPANLALACHRCNLHKAEL